MKFFFKIKKDVVHISTTLLNNPFLSIDYKDQILCTSKTTNSLVFIMVTAAYYHCTTAAQSTAQVSEY